MDNHAHENAYAHAEPCMPSSFPSSLVAVARKQFYPIKGSSVLHPPARRTHDSCFGQYGRLCQAFSFSSTLGYVLLGTLYIRTHHESTLRAILTTLIVSRLVQKKLTKTLPLHPSYFTPQLKDYLVHLLTTSVEGSCSGRLGYIIAVVDVLNVGRGKVVEGGAEFKIEYQAIVYRPFRGEIVDGIVTSVNKVRFEEPGCDGREAGTVSTRDDECMHSSERRRLEETHSGDAGLTCLCCTDGRVCGRGTTTVLCIDTCEFRALLQLLSQSADRSLTPFAAHSKRVQVRPKCQPTSIPR